ncbi:MFS transporter [Auraticoccus monumenti]|uniref:MFS transporter, SET family, sugar efflux transporter n=1 Tax=Auraticoccus monumenti TaxID=675864 RepID=A0A1G6W0T7_9ACTN|nr:MFS transporter [Auraticoccus monumenti]SDD59323.1 MFS transporter, SET family, sugar efflux transporter [Auraticoccus monumenti]
MAAPGGDRTSGSTLGLVLGPGLYRRALISLFLGGLGLSVAIPQLSLFLVQDLGASLQVAGLFFLTNLAAPVFGYLVGRWSERLTDRLTLFRLGAVAGLLGWVGMALADQVWLAFLVNLTVIGFAAATSSLIFAAVRDRLTRDPTGADNRVMSTVRLGFSLGFMTGPLLGSVLGGALGLRWTLAASGVFCLLQAAPMLGQRVERVAATPRGERTDGATGRRTSAAPTLGPLVTFLALGVLAMCGDTIRLAYLPIYMEVELGSPDWLRGVVISTQSAAMLVFIPIMGVLADRFGAYRLVVATAVLGVGANLGYVVADSELVLIAATVLNAAMWAALGGIGITAAQDLYPHGVGMASSLYFSAVRVSAAVGGVAGSLGVGALGVPGVFLIPAGLGVLSTVGLVTQAVVLARRAAPHPRRRHRGRRDDRPPPDPSPEDPT